MSIVDEWSGPQDKARSLDRSPGWSPVLGRGVMDMSDELVVTVFLCASVRASPKADP